MLLLGIGYVLGSIPFSYIVSKRVAGIDIREHGSGNAGATNVIRTLGKKTGILAFIGDFMKGLVAAIVGHLILGENGAVVCGGAAVVGHCYPFTLGFKGGKGVAATVGMIMGVNPIIGLILVAFQFIVIKVTGYMGLASILSAAMFPVVSYLMGMNTLFVSAAVAIGLFVIYRHRANLQRLLKGEENKFSLSSKSKKKA